jgi:hypothetical protein
MVVYLGVFSKQGTEWNWMKLSFKENKKAGMERYWIAKNWSKWNGKE